MNLKFARLNVSQHRALVGQDLGNGTLFNPVIYKNGYIVLSEWEIQQTTNVNFLWVKNLPLVDIDSMSMPNITPPQLTGSGVLLPTSCSELGLFPNNQFNLNGFIVNLSSTSQGLAVDLAYLDWQEFRTEQDNEVNQSIKLSFSSLWYYLLGKYQNNDIISIQ